MALEDRAFGRSCKLECTSLIPVNYFAMRSVVDIQPKMTRSGDIALVTLPAPRSVEEAAAIALTVNREAERRCLGLARELRRYGSTGNAALLEELARTYQVRADQLKTQTTGPMPPRLVIEGLEPLLPEIFAENGTAACDPFSLTPYRIFAAAVALAQSGFKLYSYLAATADEQVRDFAQQVALDELSRAARLRIARRRAFHAERQAPGAAYYPATGLVETEAELLAAALAIEGRIAQLLSAVAENVGGLSSLCAITRERVEELRSAGGKAGAASAAMMESLAALSPLGQESASAEPGEEPPAGRLYAECQRAFTFYDAVTGAAPSEAVMLQAQDLSRAALERIQGLRSALDAHEQPDESEDHPR